MKKLLLAFPLLFATAYFLFRAESSALPTRQDRPKYDTITYYLVNKEHYRTNNKKEVYKVNGHVVSKSTYDKYPKDASTVFECKPCYAKVFSKDGKPIHEGHMYTDCPVGYWKEFYPGTSRVKVEGNFVAILLESSTQFSQKTGAASVTENGLTLIRQEKWIRWLTISMGNE